MTQTAPSATDGLSPELRSQLALALDVDDLVEAMRLAKQLSPWFGVVKVGLELYSAAGPDAVGALVDKGFEVFLDLKLHDIPTTVGKAASVCGALGASYLTMHAHGGADMLSAGVEGLTEGAEKAGLETPKAVAITVLTSDSDAPDHIVPNRLRAAVESGCAGIVCSAPDLRNIRELAPRTIRVVPGIRALGSEKHDQPKAVTPAEALSEGANLLVVGRAVTLAENPAQAAADLFSELAQVTVVDISSTVMNQINEVKKTRADTVLQLSSGDLGFDALMDLAQEKEMVGATKLLVALEAMPGASKVETRRFLDSNNIAERVLLNELTPNEVETVRGFVNG